MNEEEIVTLDTGMDSTTTDSGSVAYTTESGEETITLVEVVDVESVLHELALQTAMETLSGVETTTDSGVDYTEQLDQIQDTLDEINTNLQTLSGVAVQHTLDTPLNEYNITELTLTLILIVVCGFIAVRTIVNNVFHL